MKNAHVFLKFLILSVLVSGCGVFIDNPINTPVKKIIFIDLGVGKEGLINNVSTKFQETFNVETEIKKQNIDFQEAYNSKRKQYNVLKIINQIEIIPSKEERVFAFTDKNIYSGELGFVFSSTDKSKNVGVVSTYHLRLKLGGKLEDGRAEVKGYVDENLLLERTLKTLYRNFGATMGFSTTFDKNCVMAFSDSLIDLDKKSIEFCGKRKEHLKKLGMYNVN